MRGRMQLQRLDVRRILSDMSSTSSRRGAVSQTPSTSFPISNRRYPQPPSTSQDDFRAVKDAVCSQSPTKEKPVMRLPQHRDGQARPSPEAAQRCRNRLIAAVVLSIPLTVPGNQKLVRVFTASLDIWNKEK